jgi:class 3 adenylate cyclase
MPGTGTAPARRAPTELIICFFDLNHFTASAHRLDDERLADTLDAFYRLVHEAVTASGGTVVKFLGDGALVSWPPHEADRALAAVIDLTAKTAEWARAAGLDTSLVSRLHCGTVVAGPFGPDARPHHDLIGKPVFVAARLDARTISVSAEFFRKLSPASRQLLKKHSPPIVYIPASDPRP